MNWYFAKIVFRIVIDNGHQASQFDEQIRLVTASTKKQAFEKAQEIGKNEETYFTNHKMQDVKWEFIDVGELSTLGELCDGIEIGSTVIEREDADNYAYIIQQRARNIHSQFANQGLQFID